MYIELQLKEFQVAKHSFFEQTDKGLDRLLPIDFSIVPTPVGTLGKAEYIGQKMNKCGKIERIVQRLVHNKRSK